jgi:hypothetical protein
MILLLYPLEFWDYRSVPPRPALFILYSLMGMTLFSVTANKWLTITIIIVDEGNKDVSLIYKTKKKIINQSRPCPGQAFPASCIPC